MIQVEDGTARADSQCVASVSDLNAYFTARGYDVPDSDTAEAALVRGWTYIESTYRGKWLGTRIRRDQALSWPRTGVVDAEGWEIYAYEIPALLKQANCEAAKLVIDNVDLYGIASSESDSSSSSGTESQTPEGARIVKRQAGGTAEWYEYPTTSTSTSTSTTKSTTVKTPEEIRLARLDYVTGFLLPFLRGAPGFTFTNVEVLRA